VRGEQEFNSGVAGAWCRGYAAQGGAGVKGRGLMAQRVCSSSVGVREFGSGGFGSEGRAVGAWVSRGCEAQEGAGVKGGVWSHG